MLFQTVVSIGFFRQVLSLFENGKADDFIALTLTWSLTCYGLCILLIGMIGTRNVRAVVHTVFYGISLNSVILVFYSLCSFGHVTLSIERRVFGFAVYYSMIYGLSKVRDF